MMQRPRKVRDVVELAVLRVRQDPLFDPVGLYRELDRSHKVEIIGRIMAEMPRGWARGTGGSARFARYVCLMAEGAERPVAVEPPPFLATVAP